MSAGAAPYGKPHFRLHWWPPVRTRDIRAGLARWYVELRGAENVVVTRIHNTSGDAIREAGLV